MAKKEIGKDRTRELESVVMGYMTTRYGSDRDVVVHPKIIEATNKVIKAKEVLNKYDNSATRQKLVRAVKTAEMEVGIVKEQINRRLKQLINKLHVREADEKITKEVEELVKEFDRRVTELELSDDSYDD